MMREKISENKEDEKSFVRMNKKNSTWIHVFVEGTAAKTGIKTIFQWIFPFLCAVSMICYGFH